MSKVERYVRSVRSSNLKDSEHDHHTEPLLAMAFSPVRMASALYRVRYANDATSYQQLLGNLTAILNDRSMIRGKEWMQHIRPSAVAKLALDYWINPICYICHGRGETVKINHYGGIDRECPGCNSTGKRPIQADKRVRNYVVDAVSLLEEAEIHVLRTMRK